MTRQSTLTVNGREVAFNGERNLLDVIRKAGIDLPTFCYHSDLSIYGACRLCLVQVEGRGIQGACSTPPEPGMKVLTATTEIREIRKIAVELLLANHQQACPTCSKANACQLQDVARKLGVDRVRFKSTAPKMPVDKSTPSLVRDPNKCILCGDCVRICSEIQGVGAIDFAHRGAQVTVAPAFGKDLCKGECVLCGQCAAVCPTGAITPRSDIEDVWKALNDPKKRVVAQIAPAVRVALGESFGMPAGAVSTGQIVAALRAIGFNKVFDTCFAADLTVIEEVNELIKRKQEARPLPQFTSCCPAWIKYAEQYFPELLPNLSSCRSPQQMFGSLAKETLPKTMKICREDMVVVSIMPCTAKKFEARRQEFQKCGNPDVDFVLTTQELARMIEESGIRFNELAPESLDMPLGFKTGAAVIFGSSGGVMEAALRLAVEKLSGLQLDKVDFHEVRGQAGLREAVVRVNRAALKVAVVHGLKNAKALAERAKSGSCDYDFIEVMACPGGCVGGAGQPVTRDRTARERRAKGLYETDKTLQLHKSQENHLVSECYEKTIGPVGGARAHEMLHTHYHSRRRIQGSNELAADTERIPVNVCVGTSCHLRGAQDLLHALIRKVDEKGLADKVEVQATFCFEKCTKGPTVTVGGEHIEKCTLDRAMKAIQQKLTT